MNWSNIKYFIVPEGMITEIKKDGVTLWKWSLEKAEAISSSVSETANRCQVDIKSSINTLINEISNTAESVSGAILPGVKALSKSTSLTTSSLAGMRKNALSGRAINASNTNYNLSGTSNYEIITAKLENSSATSRSFLGRCFNFVTGTILGTSASGSNILVVNKYKSVGEINNNSEVNSCLNSNTKDAILASLDNYTNSEDQLDAGVFTSTLSLLDSLAVSTNTNAVSVWNLPIKENSNLTIKDAYNITQLNSNLTLE